MYFQLRSEKEKLINFLIIKVMITDAKEKFMLNRVQNLKHTYHIFINGFFVVPECIKKWEDQPFIRSEHKLLSKNAKSNKLYKHTDNWHVWNIIKISEEKMAFKHQNTQCLKYKKKSVKSLENALAFVWWQSQPLSDWETKIQRLL